VFVAVIGFLVAVGLYGAPVGADSAPTPAPAGRLCFDTRAAAEVSVRGTRFVDGQGREVVLRGFNVSGEVKLEENGGLPFASTEDARKSARALRSLAGGNAVRFLLSWAHAEPDPGRVDHGYLARATQQMQAFLDAGLRVNLPNVARLVGSGQYGMLVWRSGATSGRTVRHTFGATSGASYAPTEADAPTELHLPRSFDPATTTVVSDLGTVTGPPAYTAHGHTADHPVATAPEAGDTVSTGAPGTAADTGDTSDAGATSDAAATGDAGARRLLLSVPPGSCPGTLHYALVSDGTAAPSAELRAAAQKELTEWAARSGFS
jgi:hypothetical protein